MARPRISDIEKRIVQVNIRLTNDENAKVNEYANASGLSPANWIRAKVFTGKFPTVKMSPLDAAIYQELKRIGVNLNQATHKINLGDFPKDYQVLQLGLLALLDKILKALIDDGQPDKG
jgi:MobC-like protein